MPPSDFESALARVAGTVADLLAAETFPARIEPAYLREAVLAYPSRGGKRLRPALVFWACELAGAPPERAAHAALAVELYHNWTLIHDDIIDHDATRRGQPTAHMLLQAPALAAGPESAAQFGCDMAILAGDILHGWALDALARSTADGAAPELVLVLLRQLSGTVTPRLISGEAIDVAFPFQPPADAARITEMLTLKTALLLEFAVQAGYMLGAGIVDREQREVRSLGDFARAAGLAFQLHDDWIGMFGNEAEIGKPVGSDLREGKYTLLVMETLARTVGPDRDRFRQFHGKKDLTAGELDEARRIMTGSGAGARVQALARSHTSEALAILDSFPASPARSRLAAWTRFLVRRQC